MNQCKPAPSPQGRPTPNTINSHPNAYPRQVRRRQAAAWRLPGGDPWKYPPPGVRGYEDAASHLLELGLTPAPNLPALQAMWRADKESPVVALIVERWELVPA